MSLTTGEDNFPSPLKGPEFSVNQRQGKYSTRELRKHFREEGTFARPDRVQFVIVLSLLY